MYTLFDRGFRNIEPSKEVNAQRLWRNQDCKEERRPEVKIFQAFDLAMHPLI